VTRDYDFEGLSRTTTQVVAAASRITQTMKKRSPNRLRTTSTTEID
jgi:hypothetical protein